AVNNCQQSSHDQCHSYFFEDNPENIFKFDFSYRQTANHQGGNLRTAVSTSTHEHGDECNEHRHHRHRIFIVSEYLPRNSRRKHHDHQPRSPVLCLPEYRSLKVRVVIRADTGHHTHVFRGLILQDQHRIVNSYNSHETVLVIDDRNCNKTVFVDHIRHMLLIVQCPRIEHILIH